MTLGEFLAALEQTPRCWRLNRVAIRLDQGGACPPHCPISAVAGSSFNELSVIGAVLKLGIGARLSGAIIDVADHSYSFWDGPRWELRQSLLRACGLLT